MKGSLPTIREALLYSQHVPPMPDFRKAQKSRYKLLTFLNVLGTTVLKCITMRNWWITLVLLTIVNIGWAQNEFCGVSNRALNNGETLKFKVYYNLSAVWVAAGEANFTTRLAQLNGEQVFHITGIGNTYSS